MGVEVLIFEPHPQNLENKPNFYYPFLIPLLVSDFQKFSKAWNSNMYTLWSSYFREGPQMLETYYTLKVVDTLYVLY